jgi:hypothetical protein
MADANLLQRARLVHRELRLKESEVSLEVRFESR